MFRVYTADFKRDAVRLLDRSDRSWTQIAVDLGVHEGTLRGWYKELGMGKRFKKNSTGKAAPAPPGSETLEEKVARLERENAQLRKKNDDLEMDRAILKKAAAFFAKESE
jgi:transposase